MYIGGLIKFSLIDYPGKMAAVVFTQGCNLRCRYCHNSDLIIPEFFRKPIPETEVLDFLRKRTGRLNGVVVTGGEPTLQKNLMGFLSKVKELKYPVKLDTNGCYPEVLKVILDRKLVDYIAMDIKAPLDKYNDIVGMYVSQEKIKESIGLIAHSGIEYMFRTTVVKSLCPEEDLTLIARLIPDQAKFEIQNFVPRKEVLDPALLDQDQWNPEEFKSLQSRLKNGAVSHKSF